MSGSRNTNGHSYDTNQKQTNNQDQSSTDPIAALECERGELHHLRILGDLERRVEAIEHGLHDINGQLRQILGLLEHVIIQQQQQHQPLQSAAGFNTGYPPPFPLSDTPSFPSLSREGDTDSAQAYGAGPGSNARATISQRNSSCGQPERFPRFEPVQTDNHGSNFEYIPPLQTPYGMPTAPGMTSTATAPAPSSGHVFGRTWYLDAVPAAVQEHWASDEGSVVGSAPNYQRRSRSNSEDRDAEDGDR